MGHLSVVQGIFETAGDYEAFEQVLIEALERLWRCGCCRIDHCKGSRHLYFTLPRMNSRLADGAVRGLTLHQVLWYLPFTPKGPLKIPIPIPIPEFEVACAIIKKHDIMLGSPRKNWQDG